GKTHLLQAISHDVLRRNPKAKVEYLTSEEFCNQFTKALQHNSLPEFRDHFRDINVLLIDDVQFFGTKAGFQEEFFHTFNAMYTNHRQIVMASDRPPQEINGLEKRLISRFESGLMAEIQPPDLETRIAIIRKKQEDQTVKLSEEVINYLAAHVKSSVRRLEGAVFNLVSHASLTKQTITIEVMEQVLRNLFHEEADTQVTVEHIQHIVAEHFDIRFADMMSKRRPASVAWPRQIAMYFARKLTDLSFPCIANEFDRTHATVLHAVTAVEQKIAESQNFKREMAVLERKLKS
ncbi:MAG: chromosomal replication initiator protein DnaA, partial [Lentisphaeria bacterium]|nr:chromosomal replication initiator protein DnaA [Lentisphaeria bacterium]